MTREKIGDQEREERQSGRKEEMNIILPSGEIDIW